jgi:hypothetical protein
MGALVLAPDSFTTVSLLQHMGVFKKSKEELVDAILAVRGALADDANEPTGVTLLPVDELGGLLASLNRDHNAGGIQLLTTLYGKDYVGTTKTQGCVAVVDPVPSERRLPLPRPLPAGGGGPDR